MDKPNFINILKSLTETMKCPKCGQAYDVNEVQFTQQLDGFCLLQLSCKECSLPVWINFFATNTKPELRIRYEQKPLPMENNYNFEPITADEVIDFSNSIKTFNGDFRKAFRG